MSASLDAVNRQYTNIFSAQYSLVPGEGDPAARLMLVGEAPGAQEEAQGRPFVGAAGKNLNAFLAAIGLQREALYLTNTVKFRPTRPGSGARLVNRTPTPSEVLAFRPWLMAEIAAIRPQVVATLGNTALRAVTGQALSIGDVHGTPLERGGPYAVFPLYHPASIIYRQALKPVYEADAEKLRSFLRSL